jgi:hypothetical protein
MLVNEVENIVHMAPPLHLSHLKEDLCDTLVLIGIVRAHACCSERAYHLQQELPSLLLPGLLRKS